MNLKPHLHVRQEQSEFAALFNFITEFDYEVSLGTNAKHGIAFKWGWNMQKEVENLYFK